ncbi:putative uncharacterized protein [Methylocaldum marinum]|uniref:DUF1287 domain-containing protein n=1 Tax=Methylocaldum marinum TaxID=1432792 RepID=A0A250KS42_9GAMM|nr:DUF1287 domain-containing protein [Methylocaldum marinum]BBA34366.1 putative uncharacterized protein [Methylocaldum marinum]
MYYRPKFTFNRIALFVLVASCVPAAVFAEIAADRLVAAALERTTHKVVYDGRYFRIPYPGGDVPERVGVCTDVVIRSYRALGIDLQVLVHKDMASNFSAYPSKKLWSLKRPDPNIDHRRVPNLQVFFARHGQQLPISDQTQAYRPGDLVTWMLPGNLPHIGIVTDKTAPAETRPLVVHNIGQGPKLEDILFAYPITGHYRYLPNSLDNPSLARNPEGRRSQINP